ncbi:MAG: WD40 repeat domain-containing protein [Ignavibacteriaceae bacterium]
MMKCFRLFLGILFVTIGCSTSSQNKNILTEIRTIELPAVEGRIDHLSIDLKSNRLFVAALGNGTVEVIDLKNGKVIKILKDLEEPQGVEFISQSNLLFVTSAGDGTCKIFDASNYKLKKIIQLNDDADNIRYNKKRKIIFVGYGSGGIAAIDPLKMELLYKIDLPGHPESFQIDEKNNLIFVNVPGAKQIEVININKKRVANKIKLKVRGNFPMALDTIHQVIFIGSRYPSRLVLFDAKTLGKLSENNISGDADDIFYDSKDSLIFVSEGSGYIDVFKQVNSKNIMLKEKIETSPGARTSLYVSELNKIFVTARRYDGNNAKVFEFSIRR